MRADGRFTSNRFRSACFMALAALLTTFTPAPVGAGTVDIAFNTVPYTYNTNTTNRRCAGDGLGGFDCTDFSPTVSNSSNVAVGDVNNDSKADVIFAVSGSPSQVCLGDGAGGFSCSDIGADTSASDAVALGYVDGNTNLDAVFAVSGQPNRVCLGDGAGGFTCSDVSADANDSADVALGYVDGDANLDVVFANTGGTNRLCLGDGSGGFTCSDAGSDIGNTFGVALGNIDGDANLDAVFANLGSSSRVCLGDGSGGFSCSDVNVGVGFQSAVALGDVDEDGNLDAVFAISAHGTNRLCLGDGTGGFSCSAFGDGADTADVVLGDVNADGHLDAVFANSIIPTPSHLTPGENTLCLGDGTGTFRCGSIGGDTDATSAVTLGDFGVDKPICPPTPASGCLVAGRSVVMLKDKSNNDADHFVWKWLDGPATALSDLGHPVTGLTSYVLCTYDETASTPSLLMAMRAPVAGTCAGKPCWKQTHSGYKYVDRDLAADGVLRVLLKKGTAGASKAIVVGKGANLPLPGAQASPAYVHQDQKVTIQLRRNDDDFCLEANFATPALKNVDSPKGLFRDKCGTGSAPPCG